MREKRPIYLLSPKPKEGVISLPMISFDQVADHIDLSLCDTLMFTSKQAVVTAEAIDPKWRDIPAIAIGSATKKQIELLSGTVIFHPQNFYGEKLAEDIADFFVDRQILYLRPEKITFDSRGYLSKRDIILQEQIIYKTICVEYSSKMQPPNDAIIIFTSPSTIDCFLKNFDWLSSYTAIVIGKSTKVHLPPDAKFLVADTPLIDACVDKAKTIL
ncbi:MAG: uroporphyrinogen-III synthase [Campylobacterota bacterium]|nr:uroporphyrinogen-III synthase [Campylobacterota bacterium]